MNTKFKNEVTKLLKDPEIGLFKKNYDFNAARRAVFNSSALLAYMKMNGVEETYEISSGVSDAKAYSAYLKQANEDLIKNRYYRSYYINKGDVQSREALAVYENLKLEKPDLYKADDFCLTEGSTGGISATIEYMKRTYPNSEALITNPCYYLYRSACQYYGLEYKEINLFDPTRTKKTSFTSIDNILKAINTNTKLIVINNPFNPSGEVYTQDDILLLLKAANKNGAILLVDELFQDLVFNKKLFKSSDKIAYRAGLMENLVVVKGYSKNKNLVALRMGYLFSKNKEIIDNVARINQVRQSFPTASNYGGLLILDAFVQSVLYDSNAGDLKKIKKIRRLFPTVPALNNKSDGQLLNIVRGYRDYFNRLMLRYSQAYDLSAELFKNDASYIMPKVSAFNTFVRIPYLDNVNMFDFTLNLYVSTGVKVEIGPCFGFDQREWETNKSLGFWLRITFAKNEQTLAKGIDKFIRFARAYKTGKERMIQTGLSF